MLLHAWRRDIEGPLTRPILDCAYSRRSRANPAMPPLLGVNVAARGLAFFMMHAVVRLPIVSFS